MFFKYHTTVTIITYVCNKVVYKGSVSLLFFKCCINNKVLLEIADCQLVLHQVYYALLLITRKMPIFWTG